MAATRASTAFSVLLLVALCCLTASNVQASGNDGAHVPWPLASPQELGAPCKVSLLTLKGRQGQQDFRIRRGRKHRRTNVGSLLFIRRRLQTNNSP